MENHVKVSATTFVVSWLFLVVLTFALIGVGTSTSLSPNLSHLLILGMMLVQAYLVAFYFMHLRFERMPLVLSVLLGVLATTGLLYALMVWDGSRIVQLSIH